jgi:hypothetical protein
MSTSVTVEASSEVAARVLEGVAFVFTERAPDSPHAGPPHKGGL